MYFYRDLSIFFSIKYQNNFRGVTIFIYFNLYFHFLNLNYKLIFHYKMYVFLK